MAKGDIQDLANLLRGDGFSKEADILVEKLEKSERLTATVAKALKTIQSKNNKELKDLLETQKKFVKDLKSLNDQDKENLKLTQQRIAAITKENQAVSDQMVVYNSVTKGMKNLSEAQSTSLQMTRNAIEWTRKHASALGILDAAMVGLEAVYESWFEQQSDWVRGMGEMATRTGASATQLQTLRSRAESLRGTFQGLGGSLFGITESLQFVGELSTAMRSDLSGMSEEMTMEFMALQRGMGLSVEETALVARTLQGGLEDGNESVGEFTVNIQEFAESIGAMGSTITRDFLNARDTLATFGEDGGNVFRRTATFANSLGFETRRVLDMFSRFDTFGAASDNINSLNAAFGTTISSFEVMTEEDPIRRIQLITDAIQAQGYDMTNMSRLQIRQLSESLGISADETARLMNGEDMAAISAEAEERARTEETAARTEARLRSEILGILDRTSQRFYSIADYVSLLTADIADILSPIFNSMHDNADGIMESIREWVRSIAGNSEFQTIIHNIADWIAEMPTNIRTFMPTWEEMKDTAEEIWPYVRQIGQVIMDIINFAVDHPTEVGIALGVLAVAQLAGGFGGIAALLSPGGAILAGVAALGYGMMQASTHADTMLSSAREIAAISAGSRTAEESEALSRNRTGALTDLTLASSGGSGLSSAWAGIGNVAGSVAGFLGATDIQATIAESAGGGTYENMQANIDRALVSGASVRDVTAALIANTNSEDGAIMVRRTLGLTEDEPLDAGIYSFVAERNNEVNPIAEDLSPSAISTAPVTAPTAAAASPVASSSSAMGAISITAADINLDGRAVGRAFFETSRR